MKKKPWLAEPAAAAQVLQKYGFRFQKRYGQNFLIDPRVPEKIVAAAEVSEQNMVIEIGPGIGTLTQYLAYAAKQVSAVEIDRTLIPILEETLQDWDNVTVIEGDVLKTDLRALIRDMRSRCSAAGENGADTEDGTDTGNGTDAEPAPNAENGACAENSADEDSGCVRVVADPPYYITTPTLMELLEQKLPVDSITVMVQKEVADRMQAEPGSKDYGALSLAVQYYTKPQVKALVPPNCFMPRPQVGSAVISMKIRSEQERIPVRDEAFYFRLVRAAFGQRRKTLANALKNSPACGIEREKTEAALETLGLRRDARGETLSPGQFAALADLLLAAVRMEKSGQM